MRKGIRLPLYWRYLHSGVYDSSEAHPCIRQSLSQGGVGSKLLLCKALAFLRGFCGSDSASAFCSTPVWRWRWVFADCIFAATVDALLNAANRGGQRAAKARQWLARFGWFALLVKVRPAQLQVSGNRLVPHFQKHPYHTPQRCHPQWARHP